MNNEVFGFNIFFLHFFFNAASFSMIFLKKIEAKKKKKLNAVCWVRVRLVSGSKQFSLIGTFSIYLLFSNRNFGLSNLIQTSYCMGTLINFEVRIATEVSSILVQIL